MNIAIGIDVGGTNTKFGIFSEDGTLLKEHEIDTRIIDNGSHVLPDIAKEVLHLKDTYEMKGDSILGIGVGMPGPVQEDGYIEACVNLNLKGINVTNVLTEILPGISVITNNDANIATIGEMWKGGGKGYTSMVMVTLGTGVGSGVVINNKVVNGYKGLGGEIGHIVVNAYETEKCNCGNVGCLDQMASSTGIVRNTLKLLSFTSAKSVLREIDNFTAKDILDAAKNGDCVAVMAVDYCMSFLGKSLADVSNTIDPQLFVIGGGVSKAGEYLIDIIKKHYENNLHLRKEQTPIVLATLGNNAGIYGAAKLVFDNKKEKSNVSYY